MDGFFYVDKPTGITSFDVLRDLRRTLWIKKLWHTGTLDPLATWGLLVAVGSYTKLISYIDKEWKTYEATILLDWESDSYDRDTEIRYISLEKQRELFKDLTLDQLEKIFQENFYGKISQVPPSYSALKIDGKRALERVRAGEVLEMKARDTEIFSYKILDFHYPKLVVELEVQAGTYIRSIAHDLWQLLWAWGYISELRRTRVGSIDIQDATWLEELNKETTLDIEMVFPEKIYLFQDEDVYKRLADGQRVRWEFPFPENVDIFLFDGSMIRYVVEHKNSVLHPRKKIL